MIVSMISLILNIYVQNMTATFDENFGSINRVGAGQTSVDLREKKEKFKITFCRHDLSITVY